MPQTVKIAHPKKLEEALSNFRRIAVADRQVHQLGVERQGGVALRSFTAEELSAPAARLAVLLQKLRSGSALTKAEEQLAFKFELQTSNVLPGVAAVGAPDAPPAALGVPGALGVLGAPPAEELAEQGELPLPESESESESEEELPPLVGDTRAKDVYEDLFSISGLGLKKNAGRGKFVLDYSGGQLLLGNEPLDPDDLPAAPTPGLAFFLLAKPQTVDDALLAIKQGTYSQKPPTRDDAQAYIDLIDAQFTKYKLTRSGQGSLKYNRLQTYAVTGTGLIRGIKPSRASYVLPDGVFGDCLVDMHQLGHGILELKRHGDIVFKSKIGKGVHHLMTHKTFMCHAGKGLFTHDDAKEWSRIAKLAHAYPEAAASKNILASDEGKFHFVVDDPKVMGDRLNVLVGLSRGGALSTDNKNEMMVLADRMLKRRHLSRADHKSIYDMLL